MVTWQHDPLSDPSEGDTVTGRPERDSGEQSSAWYSITVYYPARSMEEAEDLLDRAVNSIEAPWWRRLVPPMWRKSRREFMGIGPTEIEGDIADFFMGHVTAMTDRKRIVLPEGVMTKEEEISES